MTLVRRLVRSDIGSTAAEFGLVLPVLLAFLLGTIDVGRFLWTYNRAEKATQMGARYAAVTGLVASGLSSYRATDHGVSQGDPIPTSEFNNGTTGNAVTCTSTASTATCTCDSGATCPTLGTANKAQFDLIVTRMQRFYPGIAAQNVILQYGRSGIGFSGDPNGPDIVPLITVKLTGMKFTPMLFQFFNGTVTLPSFSSTLTMEDGVGSKMGQDS